MFKYLVALLLLVSLGAHAQTSTMVELYQIQHGTYNHERAIKCGMIGMMFMDSAKFRDDDVPPTTAFKVLQDAGYGNFSNSLLKKIVNDVYFNPAFTYARGEALANQVQVACLDPDGKAVYQPLQ